MPFLDIKMMLKKENARLAFSFFIAHIIPRFFLSLQLAELQLQKLCIPAYSPIDI